ncbi:MAG: arylsulfatase [Verrucomicrobiota bacterium]
MKLLKCFTILLLGLLQADAKPNVVLIMADDFGVGSINTYGAPKALIRTPALNRLAEDGMRFTNANTPGSICSPTRYGLVTGEYAWRGPLPFGVVNTDDPLVVETDRMTMPKYFQKLGYQTAQIGKWHLGYTDQKPVNYLSKLTPGPNDVGFDYHFGLPQNLDDKMRVWIENDGIYGLRSKKVSPYARSFYGGKYMGFDAPQRVREEAMEYLTDKAIEWIKSAHRGNPDQPFFIYFAPPSVHHPIVPSETMRGASQAGAYGDFIQDTDLSVGRIMEALEYEGIADDTIVVFTSDNGADIPANDEMRPENQAIKAGLKANGVNRGDKHTIYEGGARVPLIFRWKGRIEEGLTSDRMVNITDIYSTLVEAVTGETPLAEDAPDSISFAPTLFGQSQEDRVAMITSNAAGMHAIRHGDWKYIDARYPDGTPENFIKTTKEQAEKALFNLKEDPSEKNNLIADYPEVIERMQQMLDTLRANPSRN